MIIKLRTVLVVATRELIFRWPDQGQGQNFLVLKHARHDCPWEKNSLSKIYFQRSSQSIGLRTHWCLIVILFCKLFLKTTSFDIWKVVSFEWSSNYLIAYMYICCITNLMLHSIYLAPLNFASGKQLFFTYYLFLKDLCQNRSSLPLAVCICTSRYI